MKKMTTVIVGSGAVVLLIGGVALLTTHHLPRTTHQAVSRAVYYCPMHPTYTSDRPGDCPICNMKLVKKESPATSDQRPATHGQSAQDVCYMHTCPKIHEGRPCPMLVVAKAGEAVTCPICGTHVAEAAAPAPPAAAKKILYWTDPMMPGYKSDQPGQSPMGMALVPVYAEEGAAGTTAAATPEGYAPILVSPQKQQFIGVQTAPVKRRSMTKTIRTVGKVAYDPELYQAQQEYLQAVKAFQRAQTGTIPEVTEQAARLADSSRMRLRLLGLSAELIAEMDTWDGPDRRLLLADPGQGVWIYAPIYEYELPLVTGGQTMAIEVPARPGQALEGTIRSIDPVLDPATRSARARAVVTDPAGLLKPEMFVNASITVSLGDVLAVAEEAVFDTGTKHIVFVDRGQGVFEPRDVTVGTKADGYYAVQSGLTEGESVVTSGNFLIDSESRLKAALEGMSGEHQHGR